MYSTPSPEQTRFDELFGGAVIALRCDRFQAALVNLEYAAEVAEPFDAARCAALAGSALRRLGRSTEALGQLNYAATYFAAVGDTERSMQVREMRTQVLIDLGRFDEVQRDSLGHSPALAMAD